MNADSQRELDLFTRALALPARERAAFLDHAAAGEVAWRQSQADQARAETEAIRSRQVVAFLEEMLQGVGPSVALGQDTGLLRGILDRTTETLRAEGNLVGAHAVLEATGQLLDLVYEELRRLAVSKLARESKDQTLQPTALVHEAWLRLVGSRNPTFKDRTHFFRAAAEAMRRVLIDGAHRKRTARHGGAFERVDLEGLELAAEPADAQLLALNEVLDRFARQFPVQADLVKLLYFAGMTLQESPRPLGFRCRPPRTTGPSPTPGSSAKSRAAKSCGSPSHGVGRFLPVSRFSG